jgi:DNA-binding MarR family transcriptional regulator
MPNLRKPLAKPDFEMLSEFRYQLRRFLRFSEEAAQAEGLTPLQYQLLLQIKGFPDRDWATVSELGERLQMLRHGTVALISRCNLMGLVERTTSRSDRRQVEVRLTAAGEDRLRLLAELHRNELRSLMGVFHVAAILAFNDRS